MKILLTAEPGTGKSTILQKVSDSFEGEQYGIVAKEIRDDEGKRVGFEAVNLAGEHSVFMHVSDIKSEYVVGNKYKVDVEAINNFMVTEILKGKDNLNALVFIDEIGRAEAFSELFLQTIRDIFPSDTNFLGTIVYDDEPWSMEFKNSEEVVLLVVTMGNREYLPKILTAVYENIESFHKLNLIQKRYIRQRFRKFISDGDFKMAYKLFNNTLKYFVEGKVEDQQNGVFIVNGNTDRHIVYYYKNPICDCDLFNMKGEFRGERGGNCSHVEVVRMMVDGVE